MPFVKLDIGILDSSLWVEPEQRIMFITALCMALPYYLPEPAEELETENTTKTGFVIPPGWYGLVRASSWGIIGRTWPHGKPEVPIEELMKEIKELSMPDPWSRSDDFEGRRMVRIDGGFLILNFAKYREMDRTGAERARRYRENKAASRVTTVTPRKRTDKKRDDVTHAEAEAEANTSPLPPSRPSGLVEGKNGDSVPTTDQSKRIATIFHRKLTTSWSKPEIKSYREIGTLQEEDLSALEEYYSANWPPLRDVNVLRHDLVTFLNNITGEIDRAHAWKTKAKPKRHEQMGA